ncbi:protein PLANT CADMIUM RESISTANCE 8-like [Coffea arabica]|uniref:Protein PLANT CADMIUM RESISTANCE 8-like n=1 Tax=Coffea arabica TaxID=13443 RepID=A0ABM4U2I4_COFAR
MGKVSVYFSFHSEQNLGDQMGKVEATDVAIETDPKQGGEAVVSFPPVAQAGGVSLAPPPFVGSPWSTGLFDCHEDKTNAVMTACCPCVTFGQIAEVLDAGELTSPVGTFIYLLMMPALCSQWIMGSKYRTKLRTRYGLVEAPYQDVFSHIFCSCCSLCQEFRELRNRDLDPALGWNGILARQQGMQYGYPHATNPPSVQSMSK